MPAKLLVPSQTECLGELSHAAARFRINQMSHRDELLRIGSGELVYHSLELRRRGRIAESARSRCEESSRYKGGEQVFGNRRTHVQPCPSLIGGPFSIPGPPKKEDRFQLGHRVDVLGDDTFDRFRDLVG